MEKPAQEALQPTRGFLLGVALFCVALAFYAFLQSAYFSLAEITVVGNQYLREQDVLSLASLEPGVNIFDIDLREVERRLTASPRIASAHVVRRLPSGLEVVLVERVPIAYLAGGEGYLALDAEGLLIDFSIEPRLPLPHLGGMPAPEAKVGERAADARLLGAVQVAAALRPDLVGRVAEVRWRDGGYELLFHDGLKVRLGDVAELDDKMARLRDILRALDRPVVEIDLRVPRNPVLR